METKSELAGQLADMSKRRSSLRQKLADSRDSYAMLRKQRDAISSKLEELTGLMALHKSDIDADQAELDTLVYDMSVIELKLANYDTKLHDLVSDHAVMRYMERLLGMNVQELKTQIVAGREDQIRFAPNSRIKTKDAGVLVVKDGVVVTIYES